MSSRCVEQCRAVSGRGISDKPPRRAKMVERGVIVSCELRIVNHTRSPLLSLNPVSIQSAAQHYDRLPGVVLRKPS